MTVVTGELIQSKDVVKKKKKSILSIMMAQNGSAAKMETPSVTLS